MWLAKFFTVNRNLSPSEAEDATGRPVTIADLSNQREAAIRRMVASIAKHDFLSTRRYSYEETRLKRILRDLEDGISVPGSSTA